MSILIVKNFEEHFLNLIQKATVDLKIKTSQPIKNYLVQILVYYAQTQNLFPGRSEDTQQKPLDTLAELWLTAHQSPDPIRSDLLKKIANQSLYMGGYFSASLEKKLIDIEYYIQMGESAFLSLSSLSKSDTQSRLYTVLGSHFNQWIETLHYVAHQDFAQSDVGLLKLYENYLQTGSGSAYARLIERGVTPLQQDQLKKVKQDE